LHVASKAAEKDKKNVTNATNDNKGKDFKVEKKEIEDEYADEFEDNK